MCGLCLLRWLLLRAGLLQGRPRNAVCGEQRDEVLFGQREAERS